MPHSTRNQNETARAQALQRTNPFREELNNPLSFRNQCSYLQLRVHPSSNNFDLKTPRFVPDLQCRDSSTTLLQDSCPIIWKFEILQWCALISTSFPSLPAYLSLESTSPTFPPLSPLDPAIRQIPRSCSTLFLLVKAHDLNPMSRGTMPQ